MGFNLSQAIYITRNLFKDQEKLKLKDIKFGIQLSPLHEQILSELGELELIVNNTLKDLGVYWPGTEGLQVTAANSERVAGQSLSKNKTLFIIEVIPFLNQLASHSKIKQLNTLHHDFWTDF